MAKIPVTKQPYMLKEEQSVRADTRRRVMRLHIPDTDTHHADACREWPAACTMKGTIIMKFR